MVREGGVRLTGVAIPTLAHVYRKGQFGGVLEDLLGEATADRLMEINQRLADEGRGDRQFRFGELTPSSAYVELSHPDQAKVERASKIVDDWWKAVRGEDGRRELDQPAEVPDVPGPAHPPADGRERRGRAAPADRRGVPGGAARGHRHPVHPHPVAVGAADRRHRRAT